MTTSLIQALNAAADSLGLEHSIAVRQARAELRHTYLRTKAMVTKSMVIEPVDIVEMDAVDAFVARWIKTFEGEREHSERAAEHERRALEGETPAKGDGT
jgi:hypothetical protein